MSEKPFELTLRLRNNLLKRARLELGLSTRQMAEKVGISYPNYLRYEGLKQSPLGKGVGGSSLAEDRWKPSARKIAEFLGLPPEELWPECVLEVKKPVVVKEMSEQQVRPLLPGQHSGVSMAALPAAPDEMVEKQDIKERLLRHLEWSSPAGRRVVEMHLLDEMTFTEIGEEFSLSRERVRQIYFKAIDDVRTSLRREDARQGRPAPPPPPPNPVRETDLMRRNRLWNEVHEWLHVLPPRQQRVVFDHLGSGVSFADIGHAMTTEERRPYDRRYNAGSVQNIYERAMNAMRTRKAKDIAEANTQEG